MKSVQKGNHQQILSSQNLLVEIMNKNFFTKLY